MKISPIYTYKAMPIFKGRQRTQNYSTSKQPMNLPAASPNNFACNYSANEATYDSFTGLRDKKYLLSVLEKRMQNA